MIHELMGPVPRFMDDGTNKIYRRILADLQWPVISPGAIVVLGESLEKNPTVDDHEYWVLHEYESLNAGEIIGRCEELVGLMRVQKFFGDTNNQLMMKEMRNRKAGYRLRPAPFVEELDIHETYLSMIRERTSLENKALYFGEKSDLPEMLRSLGEIPPGKTFKSTYPKIMALGFALSAFVAHAYPKSPRPRMEHFGVLDPEVGY